MKLVLMLCVVMLLVAAAVVAGIQYDPGYVLLTYGDYTVETTVWVGIVALLVILFLLYVVYYLLSRSMRAGNAVGHMVVERKHRRSKRQTTLGLIAFIEGNWERSRRLLVNSAEDSETPLLNYLMAARASQAVGDSQNIREYLRSAEKSTSGASIAVELTQAELQLENGQLEECLATLNRARQNASKHPYVLTLLKDVYIGLSDWDSLVALLPELNKNKVLAPEEITQLERKAVIGKLNQAAEKQNIEELQAAWQRLPKELLRNSVVVSHYAKLLKAANDGDTAERMLREQLKRDWQKSLIIQYGLVETSLPEKQLGRAEIWLKDHGDDAALLLSLGRICMRNELWGKAREYFESSYQLERSGETCAELGRLLASLGEHEQSNHYFQEGLLLSTSNLPELPLPKTNPLVEKSAAEAYRDASL